MEKGRTAVPESSIQDGLNGKYVWLLKSGIATIAPVTVLRSYQPENGAEQAILGGSIGGGGIRPGDMVVSEGQLRLTPGAKVALLDTPRGQPSLSSSSSTRPAH
jgi:multidrug efflux system membrane fusion protein